MRIEALSVKAVTVAIFLMIGLVAIILSLAAGSYFRQAALDAQMNSLSRVIEVASQENLKEVRNLTFDLGMKLGHSKTLVQALRLAQRTGDQRKLVELLDDPFINGFVGFAKIDLKKLRVFDLDLQPIGESSAGMENLDQQLAESLAGVVSKRKETDRLKAVDALWLSKQGPLYSTLVPLGGLRPVGYLELIIDPAFNLPNIGEITKTPVSVFSMTGQALNDSAQDSTTGYLPVEFTLYSSEGEPAFRIIGYEDVDKLNLAMKQTQLVTTLGFLALTLVTLLFALWLFNRFLFVPVSRMARDMKQMAQGKLDLQVNKKGLKEFSMLASSFDSMANQVRSRTSDLERLLDLDDSAILCFGKDNEAVYLNDGAVALFGYLKPELADLDSTDLFEEDVAWLIEHQNQSDGQLRHKPLQKRLRCTRKDGQVSECDAVINPLDEGSGGQGYAIVLNPMADKEHKDSAVQFADTIEKNEQRMHAVEQSLNSILEIARNNPGLISGVGMLEQSAEPGSDQEDKKKRLREHVVDVMRSALACWEHDLGRTKLDLAEDSRIWPVYIDKSTPTTRTLDKYLHTDSCPKNPRSQRVIDTAEFVLKRLDGKTTPGTEQLRTTLAALRLLLSGMKSSGN